MNSSDCRVGLIILGSQCIISKKVDGVYDIVNYPSISHAIIKPEDIMILVDRNDPKKEIRVTVKDLLENYQSLNTSCIESEINKESIKELVNKMKSKIENILLKEGIG